METTSKGIVLSIVPYQDNDNVVELMMDNNKRITIFAPGTRKAESKNRQSLILGNVVEFSYFKARLEDRMSRLKKMESINTFIPEDENTYLNIKKITSLLREYDFIKYNDIVFKNYNKLIEKLNKNKSTFNEFILIVANIVSDSNTNFKFRTCAICDKQKIIKSFSLREGGIICEDDAKNYPIVFGKDLLTYIYFLLSNNYDHLVKVDIESKELNKLIPLFNEYLSEVLGLYTKI